MAAAEHQCYGGQFPKNVVRILNRQCIHIRRTQYQCVGSGKEIDPKHRICTECSMHYNMCQSCGELLLNEQTA